MAAVTAIRKPPRQTMAESVYLEMKRDIITGRHAPGTSLTEQRLSDLYGASRAPIREACRRLQQEGLLTSIPYKGYFASTISVKEIRDCFELRAVLEGHAVGLTMDRASFDELRLLEHLAAAEYTYHDHESYIEFLDRNMEFHMQVASLSGNLRLVATLQDLLASMQRYFFLGLELGDFAGEMRGEHEELVTRIQRGRKSELLECLQAQIVSSRDRILHALAEQDIGIPIK